MKIQPFFPEPAHDINLAKDGTPSASTFKQSNSPEKAFKGNQLTREED